jgi:mono/diheme cytochrome c family protein
MHRAICLLPLAIAAAACGSKEPAGEGASAQGDSAAPLGDVTYYEDVQPMLAQHCTRCHQPGGLGPGDFTDPTVVSALAPAMMAAIDDGRMPPAASDPACRDYVGSDLLTLPQTARDTFSAWVESDLPMGDPTDAPGVVGVSDALTDPDVEIVLPVAYTPAFADASNPGNEYRCFALDSADVAGRYITAMAPVVDQAALVHHIVLFTVDTDSLGDEYLADAGWDCIDGQGGSATEGMIAAWAPGMLPIEFPDGVGMEVPDDQTLVMQMHYFNNALDGDELSDRSGYAFRLTDSVDKGVFMAPLGSYSFQIPAGDAAYSDSSSFENTYFPLNVLGIFPHMHQLGARFEASIEHSDGSTSCLVSGDYDFDNQMTYQFTEPAPFGMGDRVNFECTWDNSGGDATVRYGERTDEEMCFFFTLVTP